MTRDLTEAQFQAALKRSGFKVIGGIWLRDTTTPSMGIYSMVFRKRRGRVRLWRRGSLAKAISQRTAESVIKRHSVDRRSRPHQSPSAPRP
jgi:hypothetical protein